MKSQQKPLLSVTLLSLLLLGERSESSTVLLTSQQVEAGSTNTFQAMAAPLFYGPVNLPTSSGMLAVGFGNVIRASSSAAVGQANTTWMMNSLALGVGNTVGQTFSQTISNANSLAVGMHNY